MNNCATILEIPAIKKLFAAYGAGNLYIVGGAVRDIILGRKIFDIDFATNQAPDIAIKTLENANIKCIKTGYEHGTISAIIGGKAYEITSFRKDVQTDGRFAKVEYSAKLLDDAMRRDFTINALYCDIYGQIIDPTGQGLNDIKAKRLCFVGDAQTRINEDYLRILRLYRFWAQIEGFEIDEKAQEAATKLKSGIKQLSKERIWSELKKIFCANNAKSAIKSLDGNGILAIALNCEYKLESLEKYFDNIAKQDLKPQAISILNCINPCSKNWISEIAHNLRLSNQEKKQLEDFAKAKEFLGNNFEILNLKIAAYKFGKNAVLDIILSSNSYEKYEIINLFEIPKMPINAMALNKYGLENGVKMGIALKAIEEKWLLNDFNIDEAQIRLILKAL